MARIRSRSCRRAGFTLIEMVIVLGILLLLAALLMSGIMKAMAQVPVVTTRTEIGEMEIAMTAFMTEYNLTDPPPSFLVLREDMQYQTANPLELQSLTFLKKAFGRNLGPTDWNGNLQIDAGAVFFLEGEQCLVFYLGGIQSMVTGTPACLGFNPNNMNPAAPSVAGVRRKGPFYPFAANRLLPLTSVPNLPNPSKIANGFFVYMDPWNAKFNPPVYGGAKPYAYFSSSGNNNAYNASAQLLLAFGMAGECSSLQTGPLPLTIPLPWHNGPGAFLNPKGYQILSAGRDGFWGDGDYSAGSAAAGPGHDDQANFSSRILGANQQ